MRPVRVEEEVVMTDSEGTCVRREMSDMPAQCMQCGADAEWFYSTSRRGGPFQADGLFCTIRCHERATGLNRGVTSG